MENNIWILTDLSLECKPVGCKLSSRRNSDLMILSTNTKPD